MKDLRIKSRDQKTPVTIWVNGREVKAYAGELLHGALMAAGYRAIRKNSSETEHRGFFCGMGVCYECLATIDGVAGRRTCVTEVVDGMRVEIDE